MALLNIIVSKPATAAASKLLRNKTIRNYLTKKVKESAYDSLINKNPDNKPLETERRIYNLLSYLLEKFNRNIGLNIISDSFIRRSYRNFIGNVLLKENTAFKNFKKKHGSNPPAFLVISPTMRCNLKCIGCYASSDSKSAASISYELFDKIMDDKVKNWGSYFTVISGGEPMLWKDGDKSIFDIFEKYNDNFFLVYTNGTLISKEVAKRMADLGNVTPAISVEGFEKETDARRGKGTYAKIMRAFENLREAGVPFGISVTITRQNVETIASDAFMDFYFNAQKAIYGWIFQYMPIGREFTHELMITPEQRKWLFQKEEELFKKYRVFFPDFWNSGYLSEGCIAGGRDGGYLYIDWNGDIMPCVFFPYKFENVYNLYKNGKNLTDAIMQPFPSDIRKWQEGYGFRHKPDAVQNQITPCIYRDHHSVAYNLIKKHGAQPQDAAAKAALDDPEYHKRFEEYDKKISELLDPIWKKEFIDKD